VNNLTVNCLLFIAFSWGGYNWHKLSSLVLLLTTNIFGIYDRGGELNDFKKRPAPLSCLLCCSLFNYRGGAIHDLLSLEF